MTLAMTFAMARMAIFLMMNVFLHFAFCMDIRLVYYIFIDIQAIYFESLQKVVFSKMYEFINNWPINSIDDASAIAFGCD